MIDEKQMALFFECMPLCCSKLLTPPTLSEAGFFNTFWF
jgi:hypothetical protein